MNSALAALAAYTQFIVYRATPSNDRPGKTDKTPIDYRTGNTCNPLAPENWTDQTTASAAASKFGHGCGIGFVLTANDPFFCVDLDNCLQPDGNSWSPFALSLIQEFPGAAVEVSLSGKGLHIWGRYTGAAPTHACRNGEYSIELYTERRFIALGQQSASGSIGVDCTAALTSVIARYFPAASVVPTSPSWTDDGINPAADDELIEKMLNSRSAAAVFDENKASFAQLWNADAEALSHFFPDMGDRPYDASRADAALAQHLAFWTGNDCERMLRLMFRSGLYRDKYERVDYLRRTILKACGRQENTVQPRSAVQEPSSISATKKALSCVDLVCAANIKAEAIRWLWPGWFARKKLTILAGVAGTGKTTVALSLATTLTTAGIWPDRQPSHSQQNVVIWSSEDDPADTLIPRLRAAGANLHRIHIVRGTFGPDGEPVPFDPATDIAMLHRAVDEIGGAALLMVDPIVSAVGGDMHKANDVRRSLQALVDFAAARDCAVIGISHFAKGSKGASPQERVIGSQAFAALARTVLVCAKQEDGESRVLARAKSNISKDDGGICYSIEPKTIEDNIETTVCRWGEAVEGSAREILGGVEGSDDETTERDEAEGFLRELLARGPIGVKQIKADASGAGYSWRTIERAKKVLGVKALKLGMNGGWVWQLNLEDRQN